MHCCTRLHALAEDRCGPRKPFGGTPEAAEGCPSPEAEIHMLQPGCAMHARPSSLLLLGLCQHVFLGPPLPRLTQLCALQVLNFADMPVDIWRASWKLLSCGNFHEVRVGATVFVGVPAWLRVCVLLLSQHLCVDTIILFGVFLDCTFWRHY